MGRIKNEIDGAFFSYSSRYDDGIEITRTLAVPKLTLRLSGLVLGSPFPLLLSPLKLLGVGIPIRE